MFSVLYTATVLLTECMFLLIAETSVLTRNRRVFDDTIVLQNAQASDSAVYQCEAKNTHGTLLANANIMIMSKYDNLSAVS